MVEAVGRRQAEDGRVDSFLLGEQVGGGQGFGDDGTAGAQQYAVVRSAGRLAQAKAAGDDVLPERRLSAQLEQPRKGFLVDRLRRQPEIKNAPPSDS